MLLVWLERLWTQFCDPCSPDFFVIPYGTAHWNDDGLRRKLNVYIGQTGLDPHPQQGEAYAHQGTWVEQPVDAVKHARANPGGRLHHSYLALHPNAAEAERTVCHELGHVLQMHTGGHLDTEYVGYQWEAHAEYCVHLCRPTDPGWCPHVPVFLRTSHLPVDCTNYDGEGEGAGRQYIVWPFYCFLDRKLGPRTAHSLWHADCAQRKQSGRSKDMLSNLAARLAAQRASERADHSRDSIVTTPTLGELFGEFAMASLTCDWGWSDGQSAALLASADPLASLRFTPLRPRGSNDGSTAVRWMPARSRALKRLGFCAHRLQVDVGADEEVEIWVQPVTPPLPQAAAAEGVQVVHWCAICM